MKKIIFNIIILFTTISLLIAFPFFLKNKHKDYINFSDIVEQSENKNYDNDVVRIGLISITGDNKSYILEKELANYIGTRLGKKVKLIQKKSYKDINILLKNNQVDIAFLSTGAYSLYEDKASLELLARPNRGKPYYHPIIISNIDSDINSIEDLKDKNFAFVDTYSYSGYLAINDYLKKEGTNSTKFFLNNYFTHSHEESISQVANKTVDAASVDDWALQYMQKNFPEITNSIKVVKSFPEVATGPVVTHKNYKDKEKIKEILFSIHEDEEIKNVLNQLQIKKYQETSQSEYPDLISED